MNYELEFDLRALKAWYKLDEKFVINLRKNWQKFLFT
ncbi:Uncharacterised protein [Aggregatibacter actinomycetemcomitans]|nr:hypothetical protein SA2149_05455 [Aggregatibacter actinomycetemcomitans serotype e str. SA2149]KYK80770.1 hypothetical protein SC383S_03700 [Aggregatibacter actinomycetemcomitans SC383s]SSY83461.1 Uncharacterised protein [Aggregatibacter actinomycetemcomitans]